MKRFSFFHILSMLLIVVSLTVVAYKVFVLGFPLTPDKNSTVWNIETEIVFNADDSASSVELQQ